MTKQISTICITGLLCFIACQSHAQRRHSMGTRFKTSNQRIRHIQGLKGVHTSIGISANGEVYRVGGMFYAHDNQSIRFDGIFENSQIHTSSLYRYVADMTYAWSPIDLSGFVYFTLFGGVTASYNQSAAKEALQKGNAADVGLLIGGEAEVFLIGLISIFISADQRMDFAGNWGRWRNYNSLGIRLNLK